MDSTYYHKLFRKALIEESVYDTFAEAIDEFSIVTGVEIGQESSCICTHPIMENCYVKSKITGKVLVVGSKCVQNFFPKTTWEKAHEFIKQEKRKTFDCERCDKRYVKDEDKSLCLTCRKRWKKCIDSETNPNCCKGIFFIKVDWYPRCPPCHFKNASKLIKVSTNKSDANEV